MVKLNHTLLPMNYVLFSITHDNSFFLYEILILCYTTTTTPPFFLLFAFTTHLYYTIKLHETHICILKENDVWPNDTVLHRNEDVPSILT